MCVGLCVWGCVTYNQDWSGASSGHVCGAVCVGLCDIQSGLVRRILTVRILRTYYVWGCVTYSDWSGVCGAV